MLLNTMRGDAMRAFGIEIHAGLKEGPRHLGKMVAWCEIHTEGKPDSIELQVSLTQEDDERNPFIMYMGEAHDAPYSFVMPVEWADPIPSTRIKHPTSGKGYDNCDVIFLDTRANYTDVQFGIVTRGGRFYLTMQVVFRGSVRFEDDNPLFIGDTPFSFSGGDYGRTWDRMGEMVARLGRMVHAVTVALGSELEMPTYPEWREAEVTAANGCLGGTVLYHNMITGTGSLLGQDGKKYFVHFSNLRVPSDSGQPMMPVGMAFLEPGEGVQIEPEGSGNRVRAKTCLYTPTDR